MALWFVLLILIATASVFHYLDRHRNRDDLRQLRLLYVGSPGLVALTVDAMALGCAALIVLRWFGIDIPALWTQ